MRPVTVIATGTANVASVLAGLRRAGAEPVLTTEVDRVRAAERLVLPGVGAFGAAMATLVRLGLPDSIRAHLQAGRPFLAVCLGMQLLAEASEESPGVEGLGVIPGTVSRFDGPVRVPQLGWNRITPTPAARLLREGHAAFANSYRLRHLPPGWEGALADHGGPFVAAIERGPQLACQFHPELSSDWGRALLARWLEA